jgi:hypothetical protein
MLSSFNALTPNAVSVIDTQDNSFGMTCTSFLILVAATPHVGASYSTMGPIKRASNFLWNVLYIKLQGVALRYFPYFSCALLPSYGRNVKAWGRQPARARSEPMGALLILFNKISHWSFFHVPPYLYQWPLFSVRPSRRRSDKLINVYEGNEKFRYHEFQENELCINCEWHQSMATSHRVSKTYSTSHAMNVPICTLKHSSYIIIVNDSPRYKHVTFLSLAFIKTEKFTALGFSIIYQQIPISRYVFYVYKSIQFQCKVIYILTVSC